MKEPVKIKIFVDKLCPKCKDLERPDHNCDLCEGMGFIEPDLKTDKWIADSYPSGPAWTGD